VDARVAVRLDGCREDVAVTMIAFFISVNDPWLTVHRYQVWLPLSWITWACVA
jgi:hypothetical protein